MPQNVSKRHKEIADILRNEYGSKLIAWPEPEINIGKICGITNLLNLRCDFFIWITDTCAVAIEYQSEIHVDKQIFNSDLDAIKGRDELKKSMLRRLGIGYIEIYKEDPYDIESLKAIIDIRVKEYPEIAFTRKDNTDIIYRTRKLEGRDTEWRTKKLSSSKKLQSRPFKMN